MNNTNASNPFFQRSKDAAVRTMTTGRSSTGSFGSCAPALPGGICLSGMETGKRHTTASGAGPKTERLSRSCGTSRASSTLRVVSTGASSTWTAPLCRPLGLLLAGRTMVKRGPNRTRRRRRPGARLRPRRVLDQDPPAYRPTRPPAWGRPVSRSAPRGGLLRRSNGSGVGAPSPRKTAEATRSGCRRPGLRCRLDPTLALRPRHRVGNPGPQRPPRRPWATANL